MTRRQYLVAMLALAISGLLGGAAVSWLTVSRTAEGAEFYKTQRVVSGDSFLLIDSAGKARGGFSIDAQGRTTFQMFDGEERRRLRIELDKEGAPRMEMYDENEQGIWHAP